MTLTNQSNYSNNHTLGRGLSSLIPKKNGFSVNKQTQPIAPVNYLPKSNAGQANQIIYVNPHKIIINPYQPRQRFNQTALENLKLSIKQHGILQPLVVTQTMGGKYELIAGERRLRAAIELDLKKIPIIVRATKDLEKLELSLIENIQREDLNPIEKAMAYKKLITNFHLTQAEAAQRLGIARSTLNNTLRLLQLPIDVQRDVVNGKINIAQAKLILSLNNEQDRRKIIQRTRQTKLTVHDVARDIRQLKKREVKARQIKKDARIVNYERRLQEKFSTRVSISHRGQQGGVITIDFYSDEELYTILSKLI